MFLAGTPAVELEGVVATIDGFPVLAGVDVRLERGEVVLVSGPNGAGKTSLLRVLAGALGAGQPFPVFHYAGAS
jgi:ABC-type multidrug transport system ATPase subunit